MSALARILGTKIEKACEMYPWMMPCRSVCQGDTFWQEGIRDMWSLFCCSLKLPHGNSLNFSFKMKG